MHRTLRLICLLALLPGSALAFTAFNRHEVEPVGNGVFEVLNEVGSGAQQYWCGAGDYAIRVLGAGATQRVYLWRAKGPAQTRANRQSVQFSLTAPTGVDTTPGLSLSTKRVGDNMTAASAQNYCYDRVRDEPWLFP
ncbi:hypothetical protein ACFORG_10940 [Lutimaribacter marinistellae]|uniref:Secreted protein n=1 Tax=Lutimaribacter marinistellae TaxID=1820329 RepID=A0ABV7TF80_9RHOB